MVRTQSGRSRLISLVSLLLVGAPLLACNTAPAQSDTQTVDVPLPAIRVRVASAKVGSVKDESMGTGKLHPFAQVTVAAETAGNVLALEAEQGQVVSASQALVQLDPSKAKLQLEQALANLDASRADAQHRASEFRRVKPLAEQGHVTQSHRDSLRHASDTASSRHRAANVAAQLAEETLSDTVSTAPFAGTVATVHVDIGDYVGRGTPLLTLVDLTRMKLRVGVTAKRASTLTQGAVAKVHFADLGGASVEAELHDISPIADPNTGTYSAEFWLTTPPSLALRQGMIGRLDFSKTKNKKKGKGKVTSTNVVIPRAAVVRRNDGFAVWVVTGETTKLRSVELGAQDQTSIEVVKGLQSGALVVIEGMFALQDGAAVTVDGSQ